MRTLRFGLSPDRRREKMVSLQEKRRRFVFYSKVTLGIVVVGILIMMMAMPVMQSAQTGMRIAFQNVVSKEETPPLMVHPKFQGFDSKNEPYTVTAATALQQNANTVVMKSVVADLMTESQSWLSLTANNGLLRTDKNNLLLTGQVHLFHDQGYEMVTEEAMIDTKSGDMFGQLPVSGHGQMGTFHAQGFTVYDKGNDMLFNGRIKVVILPYEKS